MLLFYIRHGDPIYDPDSLTPLGQAQADALAKRFCTHGLDRVFSSPSNRAMMTAKPTCDLLKKEITLCDWADEGRAMQDFGVPHPVHGRTWCFYDTSIHELFHSPEIRALQERWYEHPALAEYDFGRGVKRVNEAVDKFFLSLGYRHDREKARYEIVAPNRERVALFAHQGFGMCFFSSMLDIPYPTFCTRFDFGHSSMSVIQFDERSGYVYPRVLQLSNDAHLYSEGILTGYHNVIKF